ncbi:phosphodiesterase [Bacillota bacterium LX-D]|nr:phosphodiesterase [Bacillota bacterium LX-D]
MRIGIVSDTHGDLNAWETITEGLLKEVELILHAGDILYHGPRNPLVKGYQPKELAQVLNEFPIPILAARGNCDTDVDQMVLNFPIASPYLFTFLNNKRVLVDHGYRLSTEELVQLCTKWKIDLCITGHTHIALLEKKGDTVYFNPGSCSLPKGTGIPSVGIWDNNELKLLNIYSGDILAEIQL